VTIRRWDPLRDLLTLQERMNRLFDASLTRTRGHEPALDSGSWTPLADVYETPDAFVLLVELPGVREEDVEIQIDVDRIALRGERRAFGAAARPQCYHRMERSCGSFSRAFALPEEVDPSAAEAQFRDGLLKLEVPKLR
jgi:HSP20 family protein